jgi:putative transposase
MLLRLRLACHSPGMPNYRRNLVPGGTFFFTVNLRERGADLLVTHIGALRHAVRRTRERLPFHIDAWVVLPNHLHCLWTLPEGDADFPARWRAIKGAFSECVPHAVVAVGPNLRPGERGIWQRRYWEHTIRDARDYAAHMDYIHFNPVKHGLVPHPGAWRFSTFRRCVARGMYPAAWDGGGVDLSVAGERLEGVRKAVVGRG